MSRLPTMKGRPNDVLLSFVENGVIRNTHFSLKEFENKDGVAMVHPLTLQALERLRDALGVAHNQEVLVIITDGTRTRKDLENLAAVYGWIDEGGAVARDSKHLTSNGATAVDIRATCAVTKERVPQKTLGNLCRKYFLYVKDDYEDGHVHVDMWDRTASKEQNLMRLKVAPF